MLMNISIETDRDTYNPLLEPNKTGKLSVWSHYCDPARTPTFPESELL